MVLLVPPPRPAHLIGACALAPPPPPAAPLLTSTVTWDSGCAPTLEARDWPEVLGFFALGDDALEAPMAAARRLLARRRAVAAGPQRGAAACGGVGVSAPTRGTSSDAAEKAGTPEEADEEGAVNSDEEPPARLEELGWMLPDPDAVCTRHGDTLNMLHLTVDSTAERITRS